MREAAIKKLVEVAKYEKALSLLFFQQQHEDETRSWEDISPEEQSFRLSYAGDLIIQEHPELAELIKE